MSEIIQTVEAESTSLQLHVDLCAQRYKQLIEKFDVVDQRLDKIEITCEEIKTSLNGIQRENYLRYLGWAGVIITVLIGVVVTLAMR